MAAGKQQTNKDSTMARHLVQAGYPHGRRASVTHAPPTPSMKDVGSAAYRRRVYRQESTSRKA
jgi:hypothetical protein